MSKLTIALFIVWPTLLVFWVVMMILPDPAWWTIGFGVFASVCGLVVAFARRRVELTRDRNPSFPILHQDHPF